MFEFSIHLINFSMSNTCDFSGFFSNNFFFKKFLFSKVISIIGIFLFIYFDCKDYDIIILQCEYDYKFFSYMSLVAMDPSTHLPPKYLVQARSILPNKSKSTNTRIRRIC